MPEFNVNANTWFTSLYTSRKMLEMTFDAPTNAWKHVTLNIASECNQRYLKDSVFWLVQVTLSIMMLHIFPFFISDGPINKLSFSQLSTDIRCIEADQHICDKSFLTLSAPLISFCLPHFPHCKKWTISNWENFLNKLNLSSNIYMEVKQSLVF